MTYTTRQLRTIKKNTPDARKLTGKELRHIIREEVSNHRSPLNEMTGGHGGTQHISIYEDDPNAEALINAKSDGHLYRSDSDAYSMGIYAMENAQKAGTNLITVVNPDDYDYIAYFYANSVEEVLAR